ncbi:hypothetical protein Q0812_08090 [Brevundimonas sp. 2R-24]|uniref:Uncharacterized protein n=1 Tax=Peiella sedimenti TaxID=3061083 RepID=A0ABT8SPZ5_9CAUL|nr:hypothetical protein [Caulobacteraceae bacterium XZ-24]
MTAYTNTIDGNSSGATLATLPGEAGPRRALLNKTADLIGQGPGAPENGVTATAREGQAFALAEAYLSGDFEVLTITCPSPGGGNATPAPYDRRLMMGASVDDLTQGSLSDRGFATLSYVDDHASNNEFIDINAVFGVGAFESGQVQWIPYVGYQRRTEVAKEINDLTFGVTGLWRPYGHELRLGFAYETDDEFESGLYQVQLDWELPSFSFCRDQVRYGEGADQYLTCRLGFRTDYVEVGDPGDKIDLSKVDQFWRLGAWTRLVYGRELSSGGWGRVSFDYEVMEPLQDDVGDAAVGRIRLEYLPSKRSNFSVGVSYENGEDLSSLTRAEIFKLTLGLRF